MSVHAYETKKGTRYAVVVYQDGKQVWRRGFETERKAKTAERRLLSKRDDGLDINPERMTVAAYSLRWLASRKGRIQDSTLATYAQVFRTQINPTKIGNNRPFGLLRLEAIRAGHVQELIDTLTLRGLNAATVQTARRVLAAALKQAVRLELLARNPAEHVDPPAVVRRDFYLPSAHELRHLEDVADATPFGPLVRLALASGLRLGELMALEWRDLNFEDGGATLAVKRSKTAAGVRSLSIGPNVTAMLRSLRTSGVVPIGGRIFPYKTAAAKYGWSKIRTEAGLPGLRFHDLRHVHVSLLIEQGVDYKTIQERVGHSSIKVTLDVYGHLRPRADREAAAAFEAAMRGTLAQH